MKITGTNNINIDVLPLFETNYCYIIHDKSRAAVIDPGESFKVREFLNKNNLTLKTILLTHRDMDHCGGVNKLISSYGNIDIVDYKSNIKTLFNSDLEIIRTPGHSVDSCCFYLPKERIIFSGDTLFIGICGKVREEMYREMYSSLQKLKLLPKETRVLPGHEYLKNSLDFLHRVNADSSFYKNLLKNRYPSLHSTIGDEVKYNLFMTENFNNFLKIRS